MKLILKTKQCLYIYIYIYRQGEKGKGKRLGCGPLGWVDYIEKYKQVNLK